MPTPDIPVETLLRELRGRDWEARCDAARLLGQSRDPRALEALLPGLHDPDWRVRRNAAQALGTLRDARAVPPLIRALHDSDPAIQSEIVRALGKLDAKETISDLLNLLIDDELYGPRSGIYHAVTETFQIFGNIVEEIQNAFPGNYPAVFNVAGAPLSLPEAMGLLGNDQSRVLKDAFSKFQSGPAKRVEMPGFSSDTIDKMFEDMAWRFGVMFADAKDAQQDRLKCLTELLQSPSSLRRAAAALTLPWYPEERSLAALEQATGDAEETVRNAATWALRALRKMLSYRKQLGL